MILRVTLHETKPGHPDRPAHDLSDSPQRGDFGSGTPSRYSFMRTTAGSGTTGKHR